MSRSPRTSTKDPTSIPLSGTVDHVSGCDIYAFTQRTLQIKVDCRCKSPTIPSRSACRLNTTRKTHKPTDRHRLRHNEHAIESRTNGAQKGKTNHTKRGKASGQEVIQKARDRDWCWHLVRFFRYNATAAVVTATGHTRSLINCSSVLLTTVPSILTIMSLVGFNIPGFICFHSDRAHPSRPAVFFAPRAFISLFSTIKSVTNSQSKCCECPPQSTVQSHCAPAPLPSRAARRPLISLHSPCTFCSPAARRWPRCCFCVALITTVALDIGVVGFIATVVLVTAIAVAHGHALRHGNVPEFPEVLCHWDVHRLLDDSCVPALLRHMLNLLRNFQEDLWHCDVHRLLLRAMCCALLWCALHKVPDFLDALRHQDVQSLDNRTILHLLLFYLFLWAWSRRLVAQDETCKRYRRQTDHLTRKEESWTNSTPPLSNVLRKKSTHWNFSASKTPQKVVHALLSTFWTIHKTRWHKRKEGTPSFHKHTT